jgi:hypothetical protein
MKYIIVLMLSGVFAYNSYSSDATHHSDPFDLTKPNPVDMLTSLYGTPHKPEDTNQRKFYNCFPITSNLSNPDEVVIKYRIKETLLPLGLARIAGERQIKGQLKLSEFKSKPEIVELNTEHDVTISRTLDI